MGIRDDINRRNTERFINENPIDVVLFRPIVVTTTAGGTTEGEPVQLPVQRFTKINPSFQPRGADFVTADGQIAIPDYVLVGLVTNDVIANDFFDLDGERHVVLFVDESREDWAKRAAVMKRGSNNG